MTPSPFFVRDPRTGCIDEAIEGCAVAELPERLDRLRRAQPEWVSRGFRGRTVALAELSAALERDGKTLQQALERDTGRRFLARVEIDTITRIAAMLADGFVAPAGAGWVDGRSVPTLKHRSERHAFPLVGAITPWNFPLLLGLIDALHALYAGCAVVVKASELTPRWVSPFLRLIRAIDGLRDVFDIVVGDAELGAAVVERVDAVCFTGSVEVGRKVAVAAAQRLIPAFLELGGKDPLIVLETADLTEAVRIALRASVVATGQACQSIERIYVARSRFDAFVEQLSDAAREVRPNWPDIGRGDIGPIIAVRQAETLRAQLDDAVARGARVHTGGHIETLGGGLYLRPTVLTDVHHGMRVLREETFGPVLPVMPFDSVEEAIRLANDSEYGLSAAVLAGTLEEAEAVGRRLNAGAVSLNDAALTAIFGEAEKDSFGVSGLGRSRMGPGGVGRFLRTQALIAQTGRPAGIEAYAERGERG
jgi:succinate-semialdehyde dehydrogenase / glutarate-semialdehyde dehydrogenase